MVRWESVAAFKENARRGPFNYKTKPGTTDGKRAIDTVVEKHDCLLELPMFAFKFGHEGDQSHYCLQG
jgi:hypothetical protein